MASMSQSQGINGIQKRTWPYKSGHLMSEAVIFAVCAYVLLEMVLID